MNTEIIHSEAPDIVDQLVDGVRAFNIVNMGSELSKPLTIVMRDVNDKIIAGIAGRTIYQKFLINVLWVDETLRSEGLGHKLMILAEKAAIERGCLAAQVDTLAFQAAGFYQRHGFEVIGSAPAFGKSPAQYFLFKHYG